MDEESQVRGCCNITFIYTKHKTAYIYYRISPESNALVPRQQLKLNNDLLLQGHWGKDHVVGPVCKF